MKIVDTPDPEAYARAFDVFLRIRVAEPEEEEEATLKDG
jgi:hypothetical protein